MGNRNGYLTRRDRELLAFVNRYRAVTEPLLRKAFFPTSTHPRVNASRVILRLIRRGYLRRISLARGQHCLVLTHRACRAIHSPNRVSRPLTEQSMPAVLAIAWHCVRSGLTRFTDREFRERYPDLWKPGLRSSSYYLIETSAGLVLGMFLIDRGGTPRRIKGKIRRLVSQRESLPAFDGIIRAGRFQVTVLTGLPAQQQSLRRQLKRDAFWGVNIEIALVPELGELLTSR